MNLPATTLPATVAAVLVLVLLSAGPASSAGEPRMTVRAVDFTEASSGVERSGVRVVTPPGESWIAFDVEVPVAGRYRIDVGGTATSDAAVTVNLEDYIDNKDGRYYDITSGMELPPSGALGTVSKEGSPLNVGTHPMKLHSRGGPAALDTVTFTLIKAHENTPCTLKQHLEGDEWVLVWSDEFDKDGPPDPKTWAYDIGNWGWGNNEPQFYTENRRENARCEGGRLIVEARRDRDDGGWSSARLTTRGRMSFLYGRIELSARVPAGDGAWAAVWMLGDSYRDEISWPYCGEIDILENIGREIDDETGDGVTHFSCHTRAYYFKQQNQITATAPVRNMTGEFHTYAIEWTPDGILMFLDGEHHYTYDKTDGDLEFPFNNPQNLIVNLAMGGGMGGEIDPDLTSQVMELDYIRVFGRR